LIPDTKPSERIYEEDLENAEDTEEVKRKLREKKLAIADVFEGEAIAKMHENPWDEISEEEEDAWDAETILSTYTNTDNHPGVIKTTRRVRPSQQMKIELHKQFKVPVSGLIPLAEEITI
jgi:protein LTV1